jgi:hypothetical protein
VALGKTLETRLRERELASDVRAGSWARARARSKQRAFLRERWQLLTGFALLALALGIVVCALTPSPFMKGLVLGMVLAAVPGLLWSLTLQVTGTAPTMMGDEAEQWTAQELRKLRRLGWRVVNHFLLKQDDIDHVLIGPGGVYAVETKWSGDRDSHFARARERDAVVQVSSNARSMTLWSELRKRGVTVQPMVVLWGGGIRKWDETQRIRTLDGVPVMTGPTIGDWVRALPVDALDTRGIDEVWQVIEAQASARDARDRAENPVPPSAAEYVGRLFMALFGAVLGFMVIAQVLRVTGSMLWSVLVGAVTLVPAFALWRTRLLRFAAVGWIAGIGVTLTAIFILEVLAKLS